MTQAQFTFWMIAIPSTIVFILQMIMTFMVGDSDVDVDTHVDVDVKGDSGDGAPFQMYTLRNLIAFLTVFSWTGITCLYNSMSLTTSVVISSLAGLIMLLVLSSLFYFTSKLAQNNIVDSISTIGRSATVYLKIPAMGKGKINVTYGGATREECATSKVDIPTGATVKVIGKEAGILVVEPILQ